MKMDRDKLTSAFVACLMAMERDYHYQLPEKLPVEFKDSKRTSHFDLSPRPFNYVRHLKWMCHEGQELAHKDPEEATRYLGFVQGALWMMGLLAYRELERMNEE
jgi:hypothetical protein